MNDGELSQNLEQTLENILFETSEKSPREILEVLEKTGLFIFHGSNIENIDQLEPKQAVNLDKDDGKPAIFATPYSDLAIFRSITKNNASIGWHYTDSEKDFYIDDKHYKENIEGKNISGFVYILKRSNFTLDEDRGFVYDKPVKVLGCIKTRTEDLPDFLTIPNNEIKQIIKPHN